MWCPASVFPRGASYNDQGETLACLEPEQLAPPRVVLSKQSMSSMEQAQALVGLRLFSVRADAVGKTLQLALTGPDLHLPETASSDQHRSKLVVGAYR